MKSTHFMGCESSGGETQTGGSRAIGGGCVRYPVYIIEYIIYI